MDNAKQKMIDKLMQALNITSKKDFDLIMSYLASELRVKLVDDKLERVELLEYTDSRKPPSEREKNLYNINALAHHYNFIYNAWRSQIYPSLKAMHSPLASKLYDRFTDGGVFLSCIKKAAEKQLLPGEEPRIN